VNHDLPTLGNPPSDSVRAECALDFLIGRTLVQLSERGLLSTTTRAGRIVLSGHSAGGLPMLKILEADNKLAPNIAECWGFECLYFGTAGWTSWLSAHPGKRFRHFRRPNEFMAASTALKGHENFADVRNGTDHCRIVKEKWREAIDKGPLLLLPQEAPPGPATPTS
jgi:hypothetical protein